MRKVAHEHANAAVRIKWWPETGGSAIHTNPETGLNEQQGSHYHTIAAGSGPE